MMGQIGLPPGPATGERRPTKHRRAGLLTMLVLAGLPTTRAAGGVSPGSLSSLIDAHIKIQLRDADIEPGPGAGAADFSRRVFPDIAGRIPTVAEARAALEATSSEDRAHMVDRLLEGPAYARHFATVWRKVWLPQTESPACDGQSDSFEAWLREELIRGTPFDRLVAGQLAASFRPPEPGRAPPPRSFVLTGQLKPETLAANTTRVFLGLNLDCAQCHNHPFARWTRDDFWQLAAFLAPSPAGIRIEGTDRTVPPKLLDGATARWPEPRDASSGQAALANWVASGENPYFARNAVNRLWAHFFGVGLVEPLDDLSSDNRSRDGKLLDELASAFAGGFDLKRLIRAIVLSRTYQRTSAAPAEGVGETEIEGAKFARMMVRGLSGEQLYDSLRTAAGLPALPAGAGPKSDRGQFAGQFRTARPSLAKRSVPQTLVLYNGPMLAGWTNAETSPLLRALDESPFLDDPGRVEVLFLATLGRKPSDDERGPLTRYLVDHGDRRRALGNVFWALLNSTEFHTNH